MAVDISGPFYFAGPKSKGNAKKDSRHHLFDPNQERGECHGELAAYFKLGKFISEEQFANIVQRFSPDGTQKLARNAGDPDCSTYWQIIFAPPKDVSTFIASAPIDIREIALECDKAAMIAAIDYIQANCILTRRGARGETLEPAIVLPLSFRHFSNQADGPHLNTHVVVADVCQRADGTFGTFVNNNIYCDIRAVNTVYETELAKQLKERLGLKIRPLDVGGFEIEGVPKALSVYFSNRRGAMNVELAKHNATSPQAQRIAALHTRQEKVILPKEELFAKWQKEAKRFGFGPEEVRKLVTQGPTVEKDRSSEFKKDFEALVNQTDEARRTSWHLTRALRKLAIEKGVGAKEIIPLLQTEVPKNKKFIRVEWKPLTPKAPFWSPTKLVKTPRIVVGKEFKRWDKILWEKKSAVGHMRVQERVLFPKAKFGPLKDLKLPALRFGKMRLRESELWDKSKPGLKIPGGELRWEKRRLFPRAMPWTGADKLSVSVPRFVPKSEIKKRNAGPKQVQQKKQTPKKKAANNHEHTMS